MVFDFTAGNDAPMAWNEAKFQTLEGPSVQWVAKDRYGDRHVNWVRLQAIGSDTTLFFANTRLAKSGAPLSSDVRECHARHGPLDQCGGTAGKSVAENYAPCRAWQAVLGGLWASCDNKKGLELPLCSEMQAVKQHKKPSEPGAS